MTDTEQAKADAAAKQRADEQKKHADETKKKLAEDRDARSKASKEATGAVKPTPTQEENDLAASGVHVLEHEDDGSGPDPATTPQTKQSEAKPTAGRGGYATRASTPAS